MGGQKLLLILPIILLFSIVAALGSMVYIISETELNLTSERPSPQDWIKENQIKVYNNEIIIDLKGATWSSFTDTNSMDPLLDEFANGIEIHPNSPEEILIGDIIAYRKGDQVRITSPNKPVRNLDELPLPAWDLFPMER